MHKPIKFIYALLVITIIASSVTWYLLKEVRKNEVVMDAMMSNTQLQFVVPHITNMESSEVETSPECGPSAISLYECAASEWSKTNEKMETLYQKVLLEISKNPMDSSKKAHLEKIQKEWKDESEKVCRDQASEWGGGTYAAVVDDCMTTKITERIHFLNEYSK